VILAAVRKMVDVKNLTFPHSHLTAVHYLFWVVRTRLTLLLHWWTKSK